MGDTAGLPTAEDCGWVSSVTIDCRNPEALAHFWGELLGLRVRPRESRYVALERPPTRTPELVFQPVPEAKTSKCRLHLDIGVDDLPAAIERVKTLGGSPANDLPEDPAVNLRIMRDPEGNEFCLICYPRPT
jgi:predicted enzyme related to lactoylglutathione lyase